MISLCFESALPFGLVCELALIGTLIAWFAVDGKKILVVLSQYHNC